MLPEVNGKEVKQIIAIMIYIVERMLQTYKDLSTQTELQFWRIWMVRFKDLRR